MLQQIGQRGDVGPITCDRRGMQRHDVAGLADRVEPRGDGFALGLQGIDLRHHGRRIGAEAADKVNQAVELAGDLALAPDQLSAICVGLFGEATPFFVVGRDVFGEEHRVL
ncbi:hypothetical protein [Rhodopseudomonas sp. B29]|uniref:hypothetical protein n=1 Tax=Rhodopseudomonas sp. B29 TaxID=95607 RepID=UPI001FCB9F1D|nr:hypothetical protein [Rhodopseudomonas sp. B29]